MNEIWKGYVMFKNKKNENEITELEHLDAPETSPVKKKNWKLIGGISAALLVAIYGAGVFFYSSHFPQNMSANGKKIGGMTVAEAESAFTEDYDSHSIVIKEKEREEVISAEKIGVSISVDNQIKDLFAQTNPWVWFTNLIGKNEQTLHLNVTYDKDALQSSIDALEAFQEENIVAPKSAYIKAGETQFEIVPEELGNTIKKEKFISAIENCLSTCQTSLDLEKEDLYKLPKYYADDQVVKDALTTANTYTKGSVTHDFQYTTETIDYQTTKDWIKITKDFEVKLVSSDVGDYVESLGKKYNTMGSSRPFTTAYGEKRNVYGGDYGWKIYFEKEKEQLIKDIKSGETINREPIYSYTAAKRTEETDLPDSYVEVSISRQELWLFVDGKCILNSSVVTGMPPHDTYTGVYGITYKKRDDTLSGYNSNGTTYSSHVDYWMPFNGNQGLHDASWRDSFGGSIYKTNGSHGCVNCPPSVAATLYKYVDANFPVIIY